MLFAKITPAATIVKQNGPFSAETITADHITAHARPYGLGSTKVRFEVAFGTAERKDGVIDVFTKAITSSVTLEGAELAGWGEDDTVVLNAIAAKLNVSIEETLEGPANIN